MIEEEFAAYFTLFVALGCLIWFRQLSHFMAKLNKSKPFPIPDKLATYKGLVVYYKIFLLGFGAYLFIMMVLKILYSFSNN